MSSFGSSAAPNILVTGTPGTGKTTLCSELAERLGLRHLQVGDIVRQESAHEGWDEEHESYILDEDKLVDAMEPMLEPGGAIVDYHGCDFFPERWFHLVLVLRTDNTVLYDRLVRRGYKQAKLTENVECEIMQVVLEEARESYAEEIVHELPSNTVEDMESAVARVRQWLDAWKQDKDGAA